MPNIYCMECGDKHYYNAVKPVTCSSCGGKINAPTSSASAPTPEPPKPKKKKSPKSQVEEDLLSAFGGDDEEEEFEEGEYDDDFEVDFDFGGGFTASIEADRPGVVKMQDVAGSSKYAGEIDKKISQNEIERRKAQLNQRMRQMGQRAESKDIRG